MALTYSEPVQIGMPAPDFRLVDIDGSMKGLTDFAKAKVLVIAFICNHCPYVKAMQSRMNDFAREYTPRGAAFVGINPNDSVKYPDDSFEAMKRVAAEQGYVFPYLRDETQDVAKAYGAVCTPDFYVFENAGANGFLLRYRGRFDDNWKDVSAVRNRELPTAVDLLLSGRELDQDQKSSMGCSIKWK